MKQILLTGLALLLVSSWLQAERYYVKVDGAGDGSSWKEALPTLQTALEQAVSGDEIWVAAGTYVPTAEANREASFLIPSGVVVLGGFAGDEKKVEKRDPIANLTVLSGEIGDIEDLEDNSYTVVSFNESDATTTLDGFIIAYGYANALEEGANPKTCGAGAFINGEQVTAVPTIKNCIFQDNYSREGAAIYNYANEGEVSPVIEQCRFVRNRSDFNGGAIFNDGNFGICNPNIKNCHFEENESMYGACLLNRGLYGVCKPVLTACTFAANVSVVRGSVVYNLREGRGECEADLIGCIFEDNVTTVGDGDIDQTIEIKSAPNSKPKRSAIRMRSIAY